MGYFLITRWGVAFGASALALLDALAVADLSVADLADLADGRAMI